MSEQVEVAIVGAGPGGISAAVRAASRNLSHILFERREIGNTIFDYQLRKHVMAEPNKLPLRSDVGFQAGTRESILDVWNSSLTEKKVNVVRCEVTKIRRSDTGFEISAGDSTYYAKRVVLAVGVQGSPRKIGVPGEDLPHVAYTLSDPDAFTGKDILVVGAGDAAIENAVALAEKNRVSIINRGSEFARAKDGNNALILDAIQKGKVRAFYDAAISKVEAKTTYIQTPEGEVAVPCDQIIARIGAIPPRKFLDSIGLTFGNDNPLTPPTVSAHYESNIPGLFVLGSLIGYPLIKQAMNQGYEIIEYICGNSIKPADQVLLDERLKALGPDTDQTLLRLRGAMKIFSSLSEPQFRELLIESTVHVKRAGELIFERNDYTDTFFTIVEGAVSIELPGGRKAQVEAGSFFGEMGLISGRRRVATVRMARDGFVVESPRRQIIKLMSSIEEFKALIDRAFVVNALSSSIFPDVQRSLLSDIAARSTQRRFKKGEVLFREGDEGDTLYVIRKGSVKISRKNNQGQDVVQTYIAAGNYVGEMALLSDSTITRSATVTAAVGCETIAISKADFREVINSNEAARLRVQRLAEERRIENITSEQSSKLGALLNFMMEEGVTDADNFLLIDSDLCVGCDNCEAACAATHGGSSRLDRKGGKSFASVQIPISCRHCENPLCMLDCPPDALTRMQNGEVVIRDSCIGCGNCVRNCPYGVIQLTYDSGDQGFSLLRLLGLTKKKKEKGSAKAGKCDMCSSLPGGPACVRSCPTGAALRVNPQQMLAILRSKEGVS